MNKLTGRAILILGLLFVVYLGMAYSAHQTQESSVRGCERRNSQQLTSLRSLQALRTTALREETLAEERGDAAAASIAEDDAEAQKLVADEMKENAQATGYTTAIGAVTIECRAAYPDTLPWPGG